MRTGKSIKKRRSKRDSKTLEELELKINKRISDTYRPATLREQLLGGVLVIFKVFLFFSIGYVIYSVIPAAIMLIGMRLDGFFHVDSLFLYVSFGIIFMYMLHLGDKLEGDDRWPKRQQNVYSLSPSSVLCSREAHHRSHPHTRSATE